MVAIQKYPETYLALQQAKALAQSYWSTPSMPSVEVHHHHHDYWGGGWYHPVYVYEGSECSSRSERSDGYGVAALISGIVSLAMCYFVGSNVADCFNSYRSLSKLPEVQKQVGEELKEEPVLAKAMTNVFQKEETLLRHANSASIQLLAPKVALLASSVFTFMASAACASAAVGLGIGGMVVSGGIILLQNGFYSHDNQLFQDAHLLHQAIQVTELIPNMRNNV